MSLSDALRRRSTAIGVAAMVLLVIGAVVEGGSVLQKALFLTGAPVLGLTAFLSRQKMFIALEIVMTIGAILAFFAYLPAMLKYAIIIGSGVFVVGYLAKTNYFKEDAWWPLGGSGLLVLAAGLATDAVAYPVLFNSLLGVGGVLVALYSAVGFFHLKVRIAVIWLVLNIIFVINPLLTILPHVLKP